MMAEVFPVFRGLPLKASICIQYPPFFPLVLMIQGNSSGS
jgi:hypothetical protein